MTWADDLLDTLLAVERRYESCQSIKFWAAAGIYGDWKRVDWIHSASALTVVIRSQTDGS